MAAKEERVLFLTNSELGQASISMAVAYEFLIRPDAYSVHIASFVSLQKTVQDLHDLTSSLPIEKRGRIVFHGIMGTPMVEYQKSKNRFPSFNIHRIGLRGALDAYRNLLPSMLTGWGSADYLSLYQRIRGVITSARPDIAVVDPLFMPAIDAVRMLDIKHVILSPNTVKDHVPQPWLANLWKFPALCSGYPFPVPWWLIPANVYLTIQLVKAIQNSSEHKRLLDGRRAVGITTPFPSMNIQPGDTTPYLLPGTPEVEFPCIILPTITLCGPIVRPHVDLNIADPALSIWLQQRATVLINLGSHVTYDSHTQRQFAIALRMLLSVKLDVQVLWKMKLASGGEPDEDALEPIRQFILQSRLRIVPWLTAEPLAVLMDPQVVCMVHHGGANSYYEAVLAGVPQVVLPVWFDTYDFAARVEHLGIGIWGSRKSAPKVDGQELGKALLRAVKCNEAVLMGNVAKVIAARINSQKPGRVVAFEKIVEILGPDVSLEESIGESEYS